MSKLKFTADAFQVAIPHFLENEIYFDPTGTYIKQSIAYNIAAVTNIHLGATKQFVTLILISMLKNYALRGSLLQNYIEQKILHSSDLFLFT